MSGAADAAHTATPIPDDADPGETLRFDGDATDVPIPVSAPLEGSLQLGDVLGTGGMAVVRAAHQRVLERTVAVKSARDGSGAHGAALRLVAEARVTGALEHPGILPVHDILTDANGLPHIVLKRVEGSAWGDVMDDAARIASEFGASDPLAWNLEVLEAVCNAVHFAHTEGVVHRDLKPENVMVGSFGQVYVLDWGIAVSLREDPRFPSAAAQRRLVGTPRYMAPEMVDGDGARVSVQTDVYLLGALLYRILAGRAPHRGLGIREMLKGIPSFVPELPDAPPELASLVRDAMRLEPADRPASAEAFRRRLRAFAEHRGANALAEGASRRIGELIAMLADADADRVRVYDVFGAVRFGFQEALSIWPDHPGARDGLQRATLALAQWELDHGDDRAAEVLVSLLDQVPGEVAERLATARAERMGAMDQLERLMREQDPRIGRRLRVSLTILFTVLWTISPLVRTNLSAGALIAFPVAWIALGGTALALYREKWMATRTNRDMVALVGTSLGAHLVLMVGPFTGAIAATSVMTGIYLLDVLSCLMGAYLLNRAFLLPGAWFALLYLGHPGLPDAAVAPAHSIGNLLIGSIGVWMWWPRSGR